MLLWQAYTERIADLNVVKKEAVTLRGELQVLKASVANMDLLKHETFTLQRDLLKERTKVRAGTTTADQHDDNSGPTRTPPSGARADRGAGQPNERAPLAQAGGVGPEHVRHDHAHARAAEGAHPQASYATYTVRRK